MSKKTTIILPLLAITQTILAMQDYCIKIGQKKIPVSNQFIAHCKTLSHLTNETGSTNSREIDLTGTLSKYQLDDINWCITSLINQPSSKDISATLSNVSRTPVARLISLAKASCSLNITLLLPLLSQELRQRLLISRQPNNSIRHTSFIRSCLETLNRCVHLETGIVQPTYDVITNSTEMHCFEHMKKRPMIISLLLSPTNEQLFLGSKDGHIYIFTGLAIKTLSGHSDCIYSLALYKHYLFSGSADKTISIWNVKDPKIAWRIKTLTAHESRIREIAVSSDGEFLFSASHDKTICIWTIKNLNSISLVKALVQEDWVVALALSNDNSYLFSAAFDNTIRVWCVKNPETASCINILTGHLDSVAKLILSHDTKYLFSGSVNGDVNIWDIRDPNNAVHIKETPFYVQIMDLALSNDARYLFVSSDNIIYVLDVSNPSNAFIVTSLTRHTDSIIYSLALSNDSSRLFSAYCDKSIHVWQISNLTTLE